MEIGHVSSLRRFNRYFTRRIGALDDHYLGQNLPLAEARMLFEIGEAGEDGVSLRELRTRLGLDAGYLSRMVKSLEGQGFFGFFTSPNDSTISISFTIPGTSSSPEDFTQNEVKCPRVEGSFIFASKR